jgi:hypothetical protein
VRRGTLSLERRLDGREIKRTRRTDDDRIVVYFADGGHAVLPFAEFQDRVQRDWIGGEEADDDLDEPSGISAGAAMVALVILGLLTLGSAACFLCWAAR